MTCYASYVVGAFTLALVLYDMFEGIWNSVLPHGAIGALLTAFMWLLCTFVSDSLALAVLVIPILVFLSFSFGILLTGESLKRQGCCVECVDNKGKGEKNKTDKNNCVFDAKLKADPLM